MAPRPRPLPAAAWCALVPCFCSVMVLSTARSRTLMTHSMHLRRSLRHAQRRMVKAIGDGGEGKSDPLRTLESDLREHLAAGDVPADEFAAALSYPALAASGRTDLVERIMNAGGYSVALSLLGVPAAPTPAPAEVTPARTRVFNPPNDDSGCLALGATLDRRLSAPMPPLNASATTSAPRRRMSLSEQRVPSAEELVRASPPPPLQQTAQRFTPPGERFTLDPAMRVGLLALVALSAVGFGHASAGIVDPRALVIIREAAKAIAGIHVALAFYAALEAKTRLRRSAPLWFVKVLLSGPAGFVALRRFGIVEEIEAE